MSDDSRRYPTCPYCGETPEVVISAHIRYAHRRDAAGDRRCPGVVAHRESLGLPPEGLDGDVHHPTHMPRHRDPETGEFASSEEGDA